MCHLPESPFILRFFKPLPPILPTSLTSPTQPTPPAQFDSDESDDEQEPEHEKYFNYEQLFISIENELKQNHDSGYKLRLTALLQYFRLVNHQEPKMKASLCIARQLNKGPYFARYFRV